MSASDRSGQRLDDRPDDRRDNGLADIAEWRRHLHRHPELGYEVEGTAAFVAERLTEFGCDEVVTGVGRTGVVGVIHGRHVDGDSTPDTRRVIGLRADMDALPINEASGAPWASLTPGHMHACGHDGHTAMLLGAARALAADRDFHGSVALIFQPAEEGGAGGLAMVEDGLMQRFGIDEVYGLHNMPGMPIGSFAIRPGPLMACADQFEIVIEGRGGHAAMPHDCIDPVVVSAHLVLALQGIVSRSVAPTEPLVVSVTTVNVEGDAFNVIPQRVHLRGTLRAFDEAVRVMGKERIRALTEGICASFGATGSLDYEDGYPPTVNDAARSAFCADVARAVAGEAQVDDDRTPSMGAEDFSYLLQARPGAFIFMGNGDSASLHHPAYDFDDEAIAHGCRYWLTLIERALPAPV